MNWKDYQEEAAVFFRSVGFTAETDVKVNGVRTSHDIDVLVTSEHVGFKTMWIVECKHWNAKISKLHVLALREIVSEIGADRGILLAENGFQSGAIEAATLTNVQVTSLRDARTKAESDIAAVRMLEIFDRIASCKARYWDIPKEKRIEKHLRPEVGASGYSSTRIIAHIEEVLSKGMRGNYPFPVDSLESWLTNGSPTIITSPSHLLESVWSYLDDLEKRIIEAETAILGKAELDAG